MSVFPKRVHIVPLGHEIDRAVRPFEKNPVDKVYILAVTDRLKFSDEMIDIQEHCTKEVCSRINEMLGIEPEFVSVDLFDVFETMQHISRIIDVESELGNDIFVNISACGRLTSISTAFAAMGMTRKFLGSEKPRLMVYYVHADGYSESIEDKRLHGNSICHEGKITPFENFQIVMPDPVCLGILNLIMQNSDGIDTKTLFKYLHENEVEGFVKDYEKLYTGYDHRRIESRYLTTANKRYLKKLEEQGFIYFEKNGRKKRIKITESGRYIVSISGLVKIPVIFNE